MWIAVKLLAYLLCGSSGVLMLYGLYGLVVSADENGNLKFNRRTMGLIGCMLSLFLGIMLLAFANRMHQKQQRQKLKIVQKCGMVVSYYPNNDKEVLTRETVSSRRTGSYEIRYPMTLKIDGKQDYLLSLPDNFQKIPIGQSACFEIQDGSKTQGAYQNQILRTVSVVNDSS